MEIILMEDQRNLGKRGEVINVKPGYARNYLLPKGIALHASKGNVAFFEQQRKKIDVRHSKERDEAAEIAAHLASLKISISKRAGETETLYGSVTNGEIADLLAEKGVRIDRRKIDIGLGIKTLGDHLVAVDLHPEIMAELTVSVVPEEH